MFLIGKKEKTKKKQIKTKKIKFSTLGLILRGNISNDTRTGDIPTPQKMRVILAPCRLKKSSCMSDF